MSNHNKKLLHEMEKCFPTGESLQNWLWYINNNYDHKLYKYSTKELRFRERVKRNNRMVQKG